MRKINEPVSLGDVFPQLTNEELKDAEENLRRYLAVVRGIFECVQRENPKVLTELRKRARLRKEKALR